ncbi:single-stranded-DNA-specific exonuclease RecJ [Candidatus Shapirobacteria bacterium CG03_land_8_20_14_0_80_39_12]|uniref:Single-stranded-DNA-specific exonuclease RecJ n=1 Tax=Candidatus Shapirobacteria bacterium CG03_land_8_20_14_0_80_39_12 TaxID=1974879 RepID=A0A2M7BC34_9BACT|nr:MAG: single-stranded-DNA-specific exonuclease RecJ [Candidatus Shapirobacteria bacterium CG03_land_8_20_14_0_80_39_12]
MIWKILSNFKKESVKSEEIIKILLDNRGLKTKMEQEEFLNPESPEKLTAEDLGIDDKEIKKAVKRINKAIKESESIIIYGDYDADGICATAILWETLYCLTKNVLPYIPERINEGYGLNRDSIAKLKNQNSKLGLIITVDHGITAAGKIKYAKELGIDVVVCDHHQVSKEKPKCIAIVHTDKICAAAIAWFLAKEILKDGSNRQSLIANYLDLVAIASIADLEPLTGINRSLVKFGLKALNETKRCGVLAILEEAGLKAGDLGTYEVGYIIAPRLNAMGRMEHALESLRLLCTKDYVRAKSLADKLGFTNKERQILTEETVKQAKLLVAGIEGELPKFLVVDSDQYEEGIIGLVAGKLVEEYCRPALVISRGEIYSKASARSIAGFNIIEAIRAQSDILIDAGGHPMAAGLTVETVKINDLRKRLILTAEKQITEEMLKKTLKIDLEIPLSYVSMKLWEGIQKLSPFGLGNPEPIFASEAEITDFRLVGNEGKHLKLMLVGKISAVAFNQGYLSSKLSLGKKIRIAYSLSLNEWNNEKKVELKVKDIDFL